MSFDERFPQDKGLRDVLERSFREARFEIEGKKINAADFLEVVTVISFVVANLQVTNRFLPAVARFIHEGREPIPALLTTHSLDALKAASDAISVHLCGRTAMDVEHLYFQYKMDSPTDGVIRSNFTLCRMPAERIEMSIEGTRRDLFRIGGKNQHGTFAWSTWAGSAIGRKPAKRYPVYIQAHALKQLRKRLDQTGFTPYLDSWLEDAVDNLEVVESHRNGNLLVAFRLDGKRVGYLVASPLGEKMVIRTFLFLTMRITPEGRRLEQQFNLTRDEVDYLGLHELKRYTQTDMKHDKRLRKKLAKCGCEHLLDLDERKKQPEPKPFAAELKRYVGIAA